MKYIKKSENLTQKYTIKVDVPRLKSLLVLLDKDCYVRRFGKIVDEDGAFNEKEAIEKLDSKVNNANEKVNEVYNFEGLSEGPFWYHGLPYDIRYEAVYKDSVHLVRIIKMLLSNVKKNVDVTMIMNELDNYPMTEDFVSFDVRAEKALMDVNALLARKDPKVLDAIHTYIDKNIEAKLNEEYDFNMLYALYLEVLKCFNYKLIEEIRTYKTR